jgi:hypothetical protein
MPNGDIDPNEVFARWAYSELLTRNYAHVQGIEHLFGKARQQVDFTELAPVLNLEVARPLLAAG